MRLKILFSILIIFSGFNLFAQQKDDVKYISVNFNRITLEKALIQINKNHHIPIAYNNAEARKYFVTADFVSMPINQVLEQLAATANMEVTKVDMVYVLNPVLASNKVTYHNIFLKVEDIESQEPLPYALASVKNSKTFATTNTRGVFSLINIADT